MQKKLFLLGFVSMAACTKTPPPPTVCDAVFKAVTASAQGVANALDCANVPAIAATLSQPIVDLKLCANTASGLIGNLVCDQVAKTILGIGVAQLPQAWGCKGGKISAFAEQLLVDKCKLSVTF